MKLENSFEVAAPTDRVWEYLLDLEKVTPCMPGAQLTEMPDDRTWKGNVKIKLGAVSMSYAATVVIEERDDEAKRVVLKASGRETRGKGTANASIESRLEPADGRTKVEMVTDLTISGAVAQFGRGMIGDVSKRLTDQFADCLRSKLEGEQAAAAAAGEPAPGGTQPQAAAPSAPEAAKPIGGFRLGVWALWRAIARFFGRLFGRRSD